MDNLMENIPDFVGKIRAKQAGQLIGVTANTILRYAKEQRIGYILRCGQYYFDPAEIKRLVEVHTPHNAQEKLI